MNITPPDKYASTSLRPLADMQALEYILLGDLRDLLDEEPSEQTSKWLVAVLDALIDTLPQELAIKASGGYLNDVLDLHPHWELQVANLHREYTRLCIRLEAFRDRLELGASYVSIASPLRNDLSEWIDALQNHHSQERRLLQTAVNLEVGGGD